MAVQAPYVVDADGNKAAVILLLARYRELTQDVLGPAVVTERREEWRIDVAETKRRLKKNDLTQSAFHTIHRARRGGVTNSGFPSPLSFPKVRKARASAVGIVGVDRNLAVVVRERVEPA
jgi:hypothetical protein